jgi:drug/metabolite transporter (DMT)-like permease
MTNGKTQDPRRGLVILAFVTVYLLWGSTYLAIHYAVQTIPPLLMAGTRYVIAGTILYIWARLRGDGRPKLSHWITTTIIGALLLLGGNGMLVWAEQTVPSGLAALLVATEALWIVVLDWVTPGGRRPNLPIVVGLIAGFLGLVLLFSNGTIIGDVKLPVLGVGACLFAAFSWAAGSVYGQRASLPAKPILISGMQMLCGGMLMSITGLVVGEGSRIHFSAIKLVSVLGWLYLIIFGAIIGFTAYAWLVRVSTPARVSTHAYVNPVVAVILGWSVAGEPITLRMVAAMIVILTSVVLITTQPGRGRKSREIKLSESDSTLTTESKTFAVANGTEAAD